MQTRREKGLCYNCDEKFAPGHRCKGQHVYMLETQLEEDLDDGDNDEVESSNNHYLPQISLHTLSGTNTPQTMRVNGLAHGKKVQVLIDSGSTHNFVNAKYATRLGCHRIEGLVFRVMVANGEWLRCDETYPNVRMEIQGYCFDTNLYPLELQGSDVVLGMQWLRSLGRVAHDWEKLTMEFSNGGKEYFIQGETRKQLQHGSIRSMQRMLASGLEALLMQLVPTEDHTYGTEATSEHLLELDHLLARYQPVFQATLALPPAWEHDHRIPLEPNSGAINVRPYRYPHIQKAEIERAVKEMLTTGIIKPSFSLFSSPVLLVKKKDGSWRFCVDYRALNRVTIKDRYPIPVIDELLDELYGATFFTKLDLKSGYHQIRMQPEDVHKTAFRTHDGHYEFLVMPFGLTNAPATFQALMNDIFRSALRRYVLVFFDDILIYSKTWAEHLYHLKQALDKLLDNHLCVNHSKCSIGAQEVDYLGHIINASGVSADPSKISSMQSWPAPRNTTGLRGFLGLTGYYRKFIRGYGTIAAPLTQLLKKDSFKWTDDAETAFQSLKTAMVQAPILALPDFTKKFVIEADASGKGLGAVLMQDDKPIAFFSKAISQRASGRSTYEKELMAIVHSVLKWRNYLTGRQFQVRTDHRSLKYLLEQRITTLDQQRWIVKLMGFDYEIVYRPGRENKAADALSRLHGELSAVSCPQHSWLEELHKEARTHPELMKLKHAIQQSSTTVSRYKEKDGLLWLQGRLVLPATSQYKEYVIREFHDTPIGGHSGSLRTYKRPLPIPEQVWEDISMDFIEGLPNSNGCIVILVVVDRLSKYGHFLALKHPYTAKTVAGLFVQEISRLHGMPRSIVSDRDKWSKWLHWAEYWYNTSYQTSTQLTPFEVVYGRPPPVLHRYELGTTAVAEVESTLRDRDTILQTLKDNLVVAQNRMKTNADKHRREQNFDVDDLVYLKLQPFHQSTLRNRGKMKLSPRYYGPYCVLERIGPVAYRLELPAHACIHPVIHVSQLKRTLGRIEHTVEDLPIVDEEGSISFEPKYILDFRWVKRGKKRVQEALVQWVGVAAEDATWEQYSDLEHQFPHLNLEDKIRLEGEGNVMTQEEARSG
uniref:Reverse transcriptase n=1 Tax=Fagus sylvatica TaxID=28930 RepID=A0A2N9HQL5_FAGSY